MPLSHPPFSEFPISQLKNDLIELEDYLDFAIPHGADFDFVAWLREERRLCLQAILEGGAVK